MRLLAIKRYFLITRQESPKTGYRLDNRLFQADLAASPQLGNLENVRLSSGQTGQRTAKIVNLPEPLSDRELEILQLMAAGLSNQDIADRLIITLGTVKSHANHIFGKLGVQGRVKAINQARDLHLI